MADGRLDVVMLKGAQFTVMRVETGEGKEAGVHIGAGRRCAVTVNVPGLVYTCVMLHGATQLPIYVNESALENLSSTSTRWRSGV